MTYSQVETSLLLDLEQARREARVHEPKHSHPDHDCKECAILYDLDKLRRSQEKS